MNSPSLHPSPDGRFEARLVEWEARNSLWVQTPEIWQVGEELALLRFKDENWSADAIAWTEGHVLHLTLRKFPGNHRPTLLEITVDCETRQARVNGRMSYTTENLERSLESALTWL